MQELTKAEKEDLKQRVKGLSKLYKFEPIIGEDGIKRNELSLMQVSRRGSFLIAQYTSQNLPVPLVNKKPIIPTLWYSTDCVQEQEPFKVIMSLIEQGMDVVDAIDKYKGLTDIGNELIKNFAKPIVTDKEE